MKNVQKLKSTQKNEERRRLQSCVYTDQYGLNGRIDCFSVFLSVLFTIYLTLIAFIFENVTLESN